MLLEMLGALAALMVIGPLLKSKIGARIVGILIIAFLGLLIWQKWQLVGVGGLAAWALGYGVVQSIMPPSIKKYTSAIYIGLSMFGVLWFTSPNLQTPGFVIFSAMIALVAVARSAIPQGFGQTVATGLVALGGFLTWEAVGQGQEGKNFLGGLWALAQQYPVASLIIFGGLFLATAASVRASDKVDEKIAGKLDNAAERLRSRGQQ